jgi:hypothetical protein
MHGGILGGDTLRPHVDPQARYLVFHSALVLVAGLLVGLPYGRAVHRNAPDGAPKAWRLAHDTLTMGPSSKRTLRCSTRYW